MVSFDMRTRSLARSRATTVVKQEEEEVDCNTRIVQEGEGSVIRSYTRINLRLYIYRWTGCTSCQVE